MFGTKEYNAYLDKQRIADMAYENDEPEADSLQEDANQAYREYEYAAGIKDPEVI